MKKLYTSHDTLIVGFLKNLLENAGITCLIRNEHLAGAMGELPVNECWQQIWITEAVDVNRAERLLEDALRDAGAGADWRCPDCRESIEPQFARCWNCGASAPGS